MKSNMFGRLGLGRRNNTTSSNAEQTFCVIIPSNVRPGGQFQVSAGGRVIRVNCPVDKMPGDTMHFTIRDNVPVTQSNEDNGNPENSSRSINGGGIEGGSNPPSLPLDSAPPSPPSKTLSEGQPSQQQTGKTNRFEVVVPMGVIPGHPFTLLAGGMRVLVTCPKNAQPGQKIRFNLPVGLLNRPDGPKSKLAEIKLSYDKDGWTRCIRPEDMKFQWTRFDERGNVDERTRFDADRSAYVLKLDYLDNNDRLLRSGRCSLVTAERGVVDSSIKSLSSLDHTDLVSYSDIVNAQMKSYDDKVQWFNETCARLKADWGKEDSRNRAKIIHVRRDYLLEDSIKEVMSLSRKDMRTLWRINFINEPGIDAGGLAKEWFELVTDEVFDPDKGLWQMSESNQMCMQINPASGEIPFWDDHLICFRFLGRVMGKAMFERQLIKGHMVKHLYKHILGWPVMFNDLKDIDEEYYNSVKSLKAMGADVEYVGYDFTTTEERLGEKQVVELIPDGANIDVTEDNLPEYIEACLKYRLLGRYEAQLNELLLGFFDVIPEPLLTIFDFQELELLMCGLPEIDMDDWMEHTDYVGVYKQDGQKHKVCIWFWEVVKEYDHELKARLLQFVTGTSGVPARGFSALRGFSSQGDAHVKKFTIYWHPDLGECIYPRSHYPRSHTCFNRLDLPLYETREELEEKLKIAITLAATGFGIQ